MFKELFGDDEEKTDPAGDEPTEAMDDETDTGRSREPERQDKVINYMDIRHQIEDADVFMFRGDMLISRMFQAGSGSRYSHSGIVGWWHRRLMLFQAELACVQAVPVSVVVQGYQGKIDWYKIRPELRAKVDPVDILEEAKTNLGLAYGTVDVLRTILHDIAGMDLPEDCENPHALFCSQYVARCFRRAGLPLTEEPDMAVFPSEIASSPVLTYMGTLVCDLGEDRARHLLER